MDPVTTISTEMNILNGLMVWPHLCIWMTIHHLILYIIPQLILCIIHYLSSFERLHYSFYLLFSLSINNQSKDRELINFVSTTFCLCFDNLSLIIVVMVIVFIILVKFKYSIFLTKQMSALATRTSWRFYPRQLNLKYYKKDYYNKII